MVRRLCVRRRAARPPCVAPHEEAECESREDRGEKVVGCHATLSSGFGAPNGGAVVRALVRNSGTCRPDGMAGQWSGLGLRLVVWSENPKQLICEGESSDAGHRGGPTRISVEGPVMGLERRGRVVLVRSAANRLRAGGAG